MSPTDVRAGLVIGAGYFGRNWMQTIAARKDCRLAGVVADDTGTLAGALEAHGGGVHGYADLAAALAAERPGFAVVAVPESAHREIVCRLLEAGVPTICEKPLAMTRAEAQDIVAAHRRRPGVPLMIDQNFRWRPSVQGLHAAVRAGMIGEPGEIAIVHRQGIRRTTTGGWREQMPQPYLYDMAVHFFDLVRYLTGRDVEEVYARTHRPAWSWFEGAPALAAVLSLAGGVQATIGGTFVGRGFETAQEGLITIVGPEGTLRYGEDRRLRLHRDGEARELPLPEMPAVDCAFTLAHFLECLATGARPQTDLDDNLKTFQVVLAALDSDGRGQRVRVEDI